MLSSSCYRTKVGNREEDGAEGCLGWGEGNLKEEEAKHGQEVERSFHLQVFDFKKVGDSGAWLPGHLTRVRPLPGTSW